MSETEITRLQDLLAPSQVRAGCVPFQWPGKLRRPSRILWIQDGEEVSRG